MPRFTPKRFEQIMTQMVATAVARTQLSDVGDASIFKHLLAAAARQDDEQYYQMQLLLDLFSIDRSKGDDLDDRAKDIQPGTIRRWASTRAVGTVVFSRNLVSGTVTVPLNTKVKTSGGQVFTTQAVGTITPTSAEQIPGHGVGRDSPPISVTADVPGSAGNVVSGTVVKFVNKPAGIDAATNHISFTQGTDKETDDHFRKRIKDYISSLARATPTALESGVLGATTPSGQAVLFVKAFEDPIARGNVTLYIDDGTGTAESSDAVTGEIVTLGLAGPPPDSAVGGETVLYLDQKPVKDSIPTTLVSSIRGALVLGTDFTLNSASGQINFDPPLVASEVITADYTYYTGLISLAQKIVDGDPADRATYPGLRAAGVLVRVSVPQVLVQTVQAIITVAEGYDAPTVKSDIREAIKAYINSLGISGDLIRYELVSKIMDVEGVYNIILTTPAADVIILDDQLLRTTDINVILS